MSKKPRSPGWSQTEAVLWAATRSLAVVEGARSRMAEGSSDSAELGRAVTALALEGTRLPSDVVRPSPADAILEAEREVVSAIAEGALPFGRDGLIPRSRVQAIWKPRPGRPRKEALDRRKLIRLAFHYMAAARGDVAWGDHEEWCQTTLGMVRKDEVLEVRKAALPYALREIDGRLHAGLIDAERAALERANVLSWRGKVEV